MTESMDHGWREVADHVFIRRYQPVDVTITAIVGGEGIAVVDTRCSLAEARELRDDLRRLSSAPVRWVVNTHAHWDHMWGNAEFVEPRLSPPAEIWGHATVPGRCFDDEAAAFRRRTAREHPEWAARWADFVEVPPDHLVERHHVLDLGDRGVELRYLGRGHTEGDLVLHVPAANVMLAGDLVEQSGPVNFGIDCFPLEWATTLDALIALGTAGSVAAFVPGHGEPVGLDFVIEQRAAIDGVAAEVRRLHGAGIAPDEALATGDWPAPWDEEHARQQLDQAIRRGFAALDDAAAEPAAH